MLRGLVVLLLLAGCDEPLYRVSWNTVFAEPALADAAAVMEARVLRGGCESDSEVLYRVVVAPRWDIPEPPLLGAGRYGLSVSARDLDCRVLAQGCEDVRFPTKDGDTVTVTLVRPSGDAEPERVCSREECSRGFCPGDLDDGGTDAGVDGCSPDGGLEADPDNCGACGNACPTGVGCSDGVCADEVIQVSAGGHMTCALLAAGTVACWGKNDRGQLGEGTDEARAEPALVSGLSDVSEVRAGSTEACARKSFGDVVCWGAGTEGQLGNGTWSDSAVPADVDLAGSEPLGLVVSREGHACALVWPGEIACWGSNERGQLGTADTENSNLPRIVDGIEDALEVSAGSGFSCVRFHVAGEEQVACWGRNEEGELGTNDTSSSVTPVVVQDEEDAAPFTLLSSGARHTCGLSADGLRCWGGNSAGQIGRGDSDDALVPVTLEAFADGLVGVTAGGFHTCAWTTAGASWCWGLHDDRPASGTAGSYLTPAEVADLSDVQEMSAGESHTCARTGPRSIRCWGSNAAGELGTGASSSSPSASPEDVVGLAGARQLSLGGDYSCARRLSGQILCWGKNDLGQLGDGSLDTSTLPVAAAVGTGLDISAGASHACAVTLAGAVVCWGDNNDGQAGAPDGATVLLPTEVDGVADVLAVAAGGAHTCALLRDHRVFCWGANEEGQLGVGAILHTPTPTLVEWSTGAEVVRIAAGGSHTCAVTSDRKLFCWGSNAFGQLAAAESIPKRETPVQVALVVADEVALGEDHTCVLANGAGAVSCWGKNDQRQTGSSSGSDIRAPASVIGFDGSVRAIVAGGAHTCALGASSAVWCWGSNEFGQLGVDGVEGAVVEPQAVVGIGEDVLSIAAGGSHTCVRLRSGDVMCWGDNGQGQLGDVLSQGGPTPVFVQGVL